MSNEFNDDITGIFDNLTPQDFLEAYQESTAVDEMSRINQGVDAFNEFVEEQIRALKLSYTAAEGNIQPIAVLAGRTTQRIFVPDDDETMQQWINRMHREAKAINAIWTFVSKKTMVGTRQAEVNDDAPDVNDPEHVRSAVEAGDMTMGVFWYAERREGDERHHRHGILRGSETRLTEALEGPTTQAIPLFAQILG